MFQNIKQTRATMPCRAMVSIHRCGFKAPRSSCCLARRIRSCRAVASAPSIVTPHNLLEGIVSPANRIWAQSLSWKIVRAVRQSRTFSVPSAAI
jgi:hypothetical protein